VLVLALCLVTLLAFRLASVMILCRRCIYALLSAVLLTLVSTDHCNVMTSGHKG